MQRTSSGIGAGAIPLGRATVVLLGYSRTLLTGLSGHVPAGCVLVVEDPVVARNRSVAEAAATDPLVDRLILVEYQQPAGLDELTAQLSKFSEIRAVLPGVEYAVDAAARLATRLGLPGAGCRAAAIFRDKAAQRRAATAAGLRNPRFLVADTEADAVAFVGRVGLRCIIKPTARQASIGVRFVHPEDGHPGIAAAFQQAAAPGESQLIPAQGIRSEIIVEEAVQGREFSVEMLVSRGRPCFVNVTAKQLAHGAYPVEVGHLVPGCPDQALGDRLAQDTTSLLTAAGFQDGVLHCEWIVDAQGPVLVECAGRIPGDEITTLLTLAYDRPFLPAYLQVLLGSDPGYPVQASYGAAIRFLTVPAGRLTRLEGIEDAAQAPGIRLVRMAVRAGDTIQPLVSSWERAGYLVARGTTADEAMRLADQAAQLIQFSVETRERAGPG